MADTVMSVNRTAAGVVAPGFAVLALLLAAGSAAAATGHGRGQIRTAGAAGKAAAGPAASQARSHPVVLIGIGGLRWSDVSASGTPAIWQLAEHGSIGSLVDTTIEQLTCPADAWLTLNSGARAAVPHRQPAGCTAAGIEPRVAHGQTGPAAPDAGPASVPGLASLEAYNSRFGYGPHWGVLRTAAGPGQCATAVGPGAGLALASSAGQISRYLPALPAGRPGQWDGCALTIGDLGALPEALPGRSGGARAQALRTADRRTARIVAAAAPGSVVVLAGLGDAASQHLRVIVVVGPGYGHGLLTSTSTRESGTAMLITDLDPAIFAWRGLPGAFPPDLASARLSTSPGGSLSAEIRGLVARDTAEQVYRGSLGWSLLGYAVAECLLFGLIAVLLRGQAPRRVRARTAGYTAAAVVAAAVPAGTFVANLVPWAQLAHPAVALWAIGLAFAAAIGAAALAGPWRREPFGPPGFVAAVTLAVLAVDLMTGSGLELEAPFGRSLLIAGRFYGLGNNALGVYGAAGLLAATWAAVTAVTAAGQGARRRAVAACAVVAALTVGIAGWPGFGAKAGGTISMVPAFGVLLAAVAGVRITLRRAVIVAVSGLALAAVFAVISYLIPATGASHLSGFVGDVLHHRGVALATMHRKLSAMLHSVTERWFTLAIPALAVATLMMLVRPAKLGLRSLISAQQAQPLLRPYLVAGWLAAVLGWLADDSGVSVAAAALPFALPAAITLVARINAGTPRAGSAGDDHTGDDRTGDDRTGEKPLYGGGPRQLAHWSGQARGAGTPDTAG